VLKRGDYYSKLVELDFARTVGEVQDPKLISNYTPMKREQFEEHIEILKGILVEKLNSMTEYIEKEIESWLVEYVNKNEYIEVTLQQLSIYFREF